MGITEKLNNWIWQRPPKPNRGFGDTFFRSRKRQVSPNHIDAGARAKIMSALASELDMFITHLSARTRIKAASLNLRRAREYSVLG